MLEERGDESCSDEFQSNRDHEEQPPVELTKWESESSQGEEGSPKYIRATVDRVMRY